MYDVLDYMPRTYEDLTAEEFLALSDAARNNIKNSTILPAQLGSSELGGKIRVFYYTPVYKYAPRSYK